MGPEEFSEKVIILKIGQFKEADCWVRFFSPSKGQLTAFAFGGLKSKRRFCGCLEVLNYILVHVTSAKKKSYLCLKESILLERFSALQQNPLRMGMAINCVKFLEAAHIGFEDASQAFDLLHSTLKVLLGPQPLPDIFPLLFRAKLTCEYGYNPDFIHCSHCSRKVEAEQRFYFFPQSGSCLCLTCSMEKAFANIVSGQTLLFLHKLMQATPADWQMQNIPEDIRGQCCAVLDNLVQYHMGLIWKGNRFSSP